MLVSWVASQHPTESPLRQIVLDTETTGLDPDQGHRIIEIGCVELINRRVTDNRFHHYLQPDREIDEAAQEVHGISLADLAGKPRFRDIAREFLDFVRGAELIIHNAPFDVGFINRELALVDRALGRIEDYCTIVDTLRLARRQHPGQNNTLDGLCKRYNIDNSQRAVHGALLDAEILADVYLALTGGQTDLLLDEGPGAGRRESPVARLGADRPALRIIRAGPEERDAHRKYLERLQARGRCLWIELEGESAG